VIRFPAGSRIPVVVELTTPLAHAEGGGSAIHLIVDRTIDWSPRTPDRISFDGKQWQPFNEGHDGQFSLGVGKSSQLGPHANVRVSLVPPGRVNDFETSRGRSGCTTRRQRRDR
jgi:hypothetical protein